MTDTSFALEELRSLEVAFEDDSVQRLVIGSLDDAHVRIVALRDAIRRRDAKAVVRLADTLRGASAHAGAAQIALLCGTMGTVAAAGHLEDADNLLDEIHREIEQGRPGR